MLRENYAQAYAIANHIIRKLGGLILSKGRPLCVAWDRLFWVCIVHWNELIGLSSVYEFLNAMDYLTQVHFKSPRPLRNPEWAFCLKGSWNCLCQGHRSKCVQMPWLALPMTLKGFESSTHRPWAASLINWTKVAPLMRWSIYTVLLYTYWGWFVSGP